MSDPLEELERLKAEHDASPVFDISDGTGRALLDCVERHWDWLIDRARSAEQDRVDAERYRWLRDGERNLWVTSGIEEHGTEGCDDHEVLVNRFTGQCLDAAVDAAARNSK